MLFNYKSMLEDIKDDLDSDTIEWYKTTDKTNKISALNIGKSIVTSSNYHTDKDLIVCKLEEAIRQIKTELELNNDRYMDQLRKEKDVHKEEQTKQDEKCRNMIEGERQRYSKLEEEERLRYSKLEEKFNMFNNDISQSKIFSIWSNKNHEFNFTKGLSKPFDNDIKLNYDLIINSYDCSAA